MAETSDMMRVRNYTLADASALADQDDVDRTRVAAAAIDALKSLPKRSRRALYAKHPRNRGGRPSGLGEGMGEASTSSALPA